MVCSTRYKTSTSDPIDARQAALATPSERIGIFLLRRILSRLRHGRLTVHTPAGQAVGGGRDDTTATHATLIIHRWRMLFALIRRGDIGFAQSYLDGDWSSPDIAALIEVAARNRSALDSTFDGSWLTRVTDRIGHLRRKNTRAGSRRNIMAHYDLGNAFYARWLDRSMLYSSALYDGAGDTLEAAQARKLDAIIDRLDISGNEHVLEIGCGWGALAVRLGQMGCKVTALTLSPSQRTIALERVAKAGLEDRVDIRLQDYRDASGQFDRIVSIEMFEAVGETFWKVYFSGLAQRLTANGIALLQVITLDETRFESYRRDVDFIQRYIFPGGMLPTPSHIRSLSRSVQLECVDELRFGSSYALTLAEWHRRFQSEWPALTKQGFDERFKRLWEYYLKYCEGGFASGAIDVGLYRLVPVPASDGESALSSSVHQDKPTATLGITGRPARKIASNSCGGTGRP